jgi:hypothetical protein
MRDGNASRSYQARAGRVPDRSRHHQRPRPTEIPGGQLRDMLPRSLVHRSTTLPSITNFPDSLPPLCVLSSLQGDHPSGPLPKDRGAAVYLALDSAIKDTIGTKREDERDERAV